MDEAEARVRAYESSTELYKLNLSYTKVTSPIDGQVSRYYLTAGNVVTQDQTLLTTVVSLDPMYAFFDMDDADAAAHPSRGQRWRHSTARKRTESRSAWGLPGEEGYPNDGKINFVNNQLNPTTGSISVRGLFKNPKINGRVRLMSPRHVRAHPLADRPGL